MSRTMTASQMGKLGGKRSLVTMTEEERHERAQKAALRRWYEYCGDCDGCGWVEGGKTLKTTCTACEGRGIVRRRT